MQSPSSIAPASTERVPSPALRLVRSDERPWFEPSPRGDETDEAGRWGSWPLLTVGALVGALASLGFHGYGVGLGEQALLLPLVRALQDPTLFPQDALIQSLSSTAGWFPRFLAWLTERMPREPALLTLHFLLTALRFGGVLAIGRALTPGRPSVAWLGLWLVFFGRSGIGFEELNPRGVTPAACAAMLCAWAIAGALSGRWSAGLGLAVASWTVEPTYGVFATAMLLATALVTRRGRRALPLGLALAALVVLIARPPAAGGAGLDASELAALLRAHWPAPHFPSTFGPVNWTAAGLLGGLVVLGARGPFQRTPRERLALGMCAVPLVGWVVGGLWNELRPSRLVLELGVFRSSALLALAGFPLLAAFVMRAWSGARRRGASRAFVPAALFLLAFPGSAPELSVAGPEFWLPLTSSLILGAAMLYARGSASTRRLAGLALVFCTLTSFVQVAHSRVQLAREVDRQLAPWRDVQRWARDHTPRSARFLTPAYLSGFRVHSERTVVAELQDGRAVVRSGRFAPFWRSWFVGFGGRIGEASDASSEQLTRGWFAQEQTELEAIARHLEADYIVLSRPPGRHADELSTQAWHGDPLYASEAFRVYPVPTAVAAR